MYLRYAAAGTSKDTPQIVGWNARNMNAITADRRIDAIFLVRAQIITKVRTYGRRLPSLELGRISPSMPGLLSPILAHWLVDGPAGWPRVSDRWLVLNA